jgi:hypothetical protein
MRPQTVLAACAFILSIQSATAGPITYNITIPADHITVSPDQLTLSGTITTNGKIGKLTLVDIVGYDLFISGHGPQIEFNPTNSHYYTGEDPLKNALVATSTALSFDFGDILHSELFDIQTNSCQADYKSAEYRKCAVIFLRTEKYRKVRASGPSSLNVPDQNDSFVGHIPWTKLSIIGTANPTNVIIKKHGS